MRVVSLVPSASETLRAWGITPVAVTRFCEQADLATVGGTKDPDLDAIVALRPDLVVMCDQENRREDAEWLQQSGCAVHAITILSVRDNAPQMVKLAAAVGVDRAVADVAITPPLGDEPVLTAWVPIWKRPWMTINGDTYGSTMLESLGVRNIACRHRDRYPVLDIDEVAALHPDVVVAPTEPYPFAERHRAVLSTVAPVVFVDGQDLFWWGERTPSAQARLRAVIDEFRAAR